MKKYSKTNKLVEAITVLAVRCVFADEIAVISGALHVANGSLVATRHHYTLVCTLRSHRGYNMAVSAGKSPLVSVGG